MEKIVGIIDVMQEYAKRLAVYLNNNRSFPYRAVVFSSAKEAENYVKRDAICMILAAEQFETEVLELLAGTKVKLVLLSEEQGRSDMTCVYRYQSAKVLVRMFTESKTEEKKIPVIGFFSPAGGVFSESLSRKIAEEFGKKGKVLYLPLFPFGCCKREWGDGFSEVLFFLRQKAEQRGVNIRAALQRSEGMDMIGPVRWYTDLDNVTKEDMERLFCPENWDTEYRAYIIAVGQFDAAGRTVLRCCDKVLVPVVDTEEGRRLQEEFRRQLKESGETRLYSGMSEFFVKEIGDGAWEEAVKEAVKKGGEVFERGTGEDAGSYSQADTGKNGLVGGTYR